MKRWVKLLLTLGIGLLALTSNTPNAATPQVGNPSSYNYFAGGFDGEPQTNITVLTDQKVPLTAKSSSAWIYFGPFRTVTYSWFLYHADGNFWSTEKVTNQQPIDQASMYEFSSHAPGTYYLQVMARWWSTAGETFIGTYYSRVIVVNVVSRSVPATGISVSLPKTALLPGMSTQAVATVTPANTTSPVTWSISPANIATIDPQTGAIQTKPGTEGILTVTATANNKSASATLYVGGLANQSVEPGGTVTFTVQGAPNGNLRYQWYEVAKNGALTPISGATSATLQFQTNKSPNLNTNPDNNRRFQVEIWMPTTNETLFTRIATLNLTQPAGGPIPWLKSVPNFQIDPVNVAEIMQSNVNPGLKVDQGIEIEDVGPATGSWQLSAKLSPFISADGRYQLTSDLILSIYNYPTRLFSNQTVPISGMIRGTTWTISSEQLNSSSLFVFQSNRVQAGTYSATINWQLSLVPDPASAQN